VVNCKLYAIHIHASLYNWKCRFGYTHFLHTRELCERNVKFIWHDVVCQYFPWSERVDFDCPEAVNMKPCLPLMHSKAHSWHCQVICRVCVMRAIVSLLYSRSYGEDAGKMVLVVGLEKIWNYYSVICLSGHFRRGICWLPVKLYCYCSIHHILCCRARRISD